jgi:hypothetical protein
VDVDGDGIDEIAVGRGFGRGVLDAPAQLAVLRPGALDAPEMLPLPATSRAQIIGIAPDPGRPGAMWIGMFESKYMVAVLRAERDARGAWTVQTIDSLRVATGIAAGDVDGDGVAELALARPYGDTKFAAGDVFLLGADRARTPLPSRRGARAIAIAGERVVFTDGWHREYGNKARALVSVATRDGGAWKSQVLVRVANRFGYDRLRIGDIDGDGAPDAIAAGNGPAVAVPGLKPVAGQISSLGTEDAVDAFPADLDGDGRDEVVLAGERPGIWRGPAAAAKPAAAKPAAATGAAAPKPVTPTPPPAR